ncbi:MAG: hypothetical protein IPI07_03960 [Flavobacteriales bacterium]|nr:hypothetical protein [Flavobacteriales bacterium]
MDGSTSCSEQRRMGRTCSSICVLSDDRFLIGGSQTGGAAGSFLLAMFASNGTLDPNFGIGGYTTATTTQFYQNMLYSLLIQGDGRIVAAGSGLSTSRICRFEPNGAIDLTFGTDGWADRTFPTVTFPTSNGCLRPRGMAMPTTLAIAMMPWF